MDPSNVIQEIRKLKEQAVKDNLYELAGMLRRFEHELNQYNDTYLCRPCRPYAESTKYGLWAHVLRNDHPE